jgi:hypothetical protein
MKKEDLKQANQISNNLLTDKLKPSLRHEINAMQKIADALQHLDKDAVLRVLNWAGEAFNHE